MECHIVIKHVILILENVTIKNKLEIFGGGVGQRGDVKFSKKFEDHWHRRDQRVSPFWRMLWVIIP